MTTAVLSYHERELRMLHAEPPRPEYAKRKRTMSAEMMVEVAPDHKPACRPAVYSPCEPPEQAQIENPVSEFQRLYNEIKCDSAFAWQSMLVMAIRDENPLAQATAAEVLYGIDSYVVATENKEMAAKFTESCSGWLFEGIRRGCMYAQYFAGLFYEYAGAENDTIRARALMKMAADQGLSCAQYVLGKMYLRLNTPESRAEALTLFERAAEAGYAPAQCQLGHHYAWNEMTRDPINVSKYFSLAAAQGYIEAQHVMSLRLWRHKAFYLISEEAALKHVTNAADRGCRRAAYSLARYKQRRTTGSKVKSDATVDEERLEVERILMSINIGSVSRNVSTGSSDVPAEVDFVQAVETYQLAVNQGDCKAAILLGHCYRLGNGVGTNATEAFRLYSLAALWGAADGYYHMAQALAKGFGVKQDIAAARVHFHLALQKNNDCRGLMQELLSDEQLIASKWELENNKRSFRWTVSPTSVAL